MPAHATHLLLLPLSNELIRTANGQFSYFYLNFFLVHLIDIRHAVMLTLKRLINSSVLFVFWFSVLFFSFSAAFPFETWNMLIERKRENSEMLFQISMLKSPCFRLAHEKSINQNREYFSILCWPHGLIWDRKCQGNLNCAHFCVLLIHSSMSIEMNQFIFLHAAKQSKAKRRIQFADFFKAFWYKWINQQMAYTLTLFLISLMWQLFIICCVKFCGIKSEMCAHFENCKKKTTTTSNQQKYECNKRLPCERRKKIEDESKDGRNTRQKHTERGRERKSEATHTSAYIQLTLKTN